MNPQAVLILDPANPAALATEVLTRVWRTTLEQPGHALLRFRTPIDSRVLRKTMFALIDAFPVRFVPERLGRFDQQVSSKFHRDAGSLASLLLLGYEATTVQSRYWVADVSAAAVAEGVALNQYLAAFNPMFPAGAAKLAPFVTELEPPQGESFLLAINNSQLPFDPVARNPLGLLHRAVIGEPNPIARRVINSVGLTPGVSTNVTVELGRFLSSDDLD